MKLAIIVLILSVTCLVYAKDHGHKKVISGSNNKVMVDNNIALRSTGNKNKALNDAKGSTLSNMIPTGEPCTPVIKGRSQCASIRDYCAVPAGGGEATCQHRKQGKQGDRCGNVIDDAEFYCDYIGENGTQELSCNGRESCTVSFYGGICQPNKPEGSPCDPFDNASPFPECNDGLLCYKPDSNNANSLLPLPEGFQCLSAVSIIMSSMW